MKLGTHNFSDEIKSRIFYQEGTPYFKSFLSDSLVLDLPIKHTTSGASIALFDPLMHLNIINEIASLLVPEVISLEISYGKPFVLVSAESKGPVLAQALNNYFPNAISDHIVLKKNKPWYYDCEVISTSTVTSGEHNLYLPNPERIHKGSHILFVDDVYSSGNTFNSISEFFNNNFKCEVDGLFIFREISSEFISVPDNVHYISWIPILTNFSGLYPATN